MLLLCEKINIFFCLVAVVLYNYLEVSFRSPLTLYRHRLLHSIVFYCIGLAICLLLQRLRHLHQGRREGKPVGWSQTIAKYRTDYFTAGQLFHDLRIINCIAIMFSCFINLKHLIPFITTRNFDQQFYDFESSLFGGKLLGLHLVKLFGSTAAYPLSMGYVFFYSYVGLLLFYIVLQRKIPIAGQFAAYFSLLWFLGILMVYLIPTLGPCFYQPSLFSFLPVTSVTELQQRLWEHRTVLATSPHSPGAVYLISGFPSLHLAVPILGSIFLGRINRFLALCSWCFVAVTALTTLFFGWHYVVDDIGSLALVFVVMYLGAAFERVSKSKEVERRQAP